MAAVALSSCNMDYNEYTAYDKEYIERSFAYVGGLMTMVYNDIDTAFLCSNKTESGSCLYFFTIVCRDMYRQDW